jgi:metal-responsive CopG/Arc/MetJ family transcriptional regulator
MTLTLAKELLREIDKLCKQKMLNRSQLICEMVRSLQSGPKSDDPYTES